ncbi:hypothetical protein C8Q76DRAFT_851959 [Earliella scabrosa]|nr:hypothetical protein C8Q76DRAFT_851959 [Earliella scabrosa]
MLGTATNPLANFQFSTIGQPPSLLSRFSNAENVGPQRAPSPPPSPLSESSPRMPAPPASRLLEALAPQEVNTPPRNAQNGAQAPSSSRKESRTKDAPPHAALNAQNDLRRTPLASAPPSSHSPSPSSLSTRVSPNSSNASALRPSLLPTKTSGPSSSNLLGLGAASSPTRPSPALPQADDALESFRQTLKRLQAEADEFRRSEEETRLATARQQDHAARWHARADAAVEGIQHLFAAAEQRVLQAEQRAAQLAHLEAEAARREEEVQETRAALARAQAENAELRREFEQERVRAAQRRTADESRIADALSKAEEAVKRADDAIKQGKSRERELAIAETLLRKKNEDDRARWDARERELLAQLEALRTQSAAEKKILQVELEEYKRLAELEKQRRLDELVEEKRRLEERLAREGAAAAAGGRDEPSEVGRSTASAHTTPAPTTVPGVTQPSVSTPPGPAQDPASRTRTHKELHLNTGALVSSAPLAGVASTAVAPGSSTVDAVGQAEPLLAVKVEEKTPVKAEGHSPTVPLFQDRSERSAEPHAPRREQSLDYASQQPTPTTTSAPAPAPASVPQPSPIAQPPTVQRAETPGVSLGYPSPEPSLAPESTERLPSPPLIITHGRPMGLPTAQSEPSLMHRFSNQRIPSRERVTSQDTARRSRSNTPPPDRGRKLIRRRGNDHYSPLPQPPPAYLSASYSRRSDHYSPSPPPREADHWSPGPGRPYNRDDRYTPPVRHKRTRDELSPDSPNARRPRLEGPSNSSSSSSSLAQRLAGPPHYDERRARSPDRYHPRSPSPTTNANTNANTWRGREPQPQRYPPPPLPPVPPPRDGARTPPYPPDHPMYGYAAPGGPTAFQDTEAPSSQIATAAAAPHSAALPPHAPLGPHPSRVPAKKAAAATAGAPPARKQAHKQLPPQPGPGVGKKSLMERMTDGQGGVAGGAGAGAAGEGGGGGGPGGYAVKRPSLGQKHLPARPTTNKTGNGAAATGARGPQARYGQQQQAHGPKGTPKGKPLSQRLQSGPAPALAERLS